MRTFTPEQLAEILALHKRWLDGVEGGVRADLSCANLYGADLSFADLSDADLSDANLSRANLSRANLSDANLSDAKFVTTARRFAYIPGTTPYAPDWDNGDAECGGGLHFSPHPILTLEFECDAKRFVGCPVWLDEIVIHPKGAYPQKVKAPRVAMPCFEVDIDGDPI